MRWMLLVLLFALLAAPASASTPTATVITSNYHMSVYGSPDLLFTAQVTAETGTPAGVVQFQVDGEDDGPPVALDPQGRAVFDSTYYLDVGAQVTARYMGTAEFEPSRADFRPSIAWAPTATVAMLTPKAGGGFDLLIRVTNESTEVIPFGSVEVWIDGAQAGPALPLDANGEARYTGGETLGIGLHPVEVFYADDTGEPADFQPSTDSTRYLLRPPRAVAPVATPLLPPVPVSPPAPVAAPPFALTAATASRTGTITLRTAVPTAGTVAVTARARRLAVYGRASKTVAARGPATVVLRPTAAARRALAKGRAVRVDVTLRFRPSVGGATQTLTRRVTVKPRRAKGSRAPSPGS
jgi:hypothetical protein